MPTNASNPEVFLTQCNVVVPNVGVEWLSLLLLVRESGVQTSAWSLAAVADVFMAFQVCAWIVCYVGLQP